MLRTYIWGTGIDNLLSFTDHTTSTTYYAIKDHQNTILALVDSTGTIVESYEYSAYGEILDVKDATGNSIANQQSVIGNRYTFQGREIDWATGLMYFRARWYNPETGRWLSKDPIGISGGLNLYEAFGSSPVNYRDPSGLWTVVIGGAAQIQLLPSGGVDGGLAVGHSEENGWSIGFVESLSGGLGTPSGFAGGFIQVTNADSVSDLDGFSLQAGGSLEFGPAVGLDYVGGIDNLLDPLAYHGGQLNIGAGFSPVVGEVHGMISGSLVQTLYEQRPKECP